MENKQIELQTLSLNLNDAVNSIETNVIALNDVAALAAKLRIKMDNIDKENAKLYWHEIHRAVRVIDELAYIATEKIKKNHQDTSQIEQEIRERCEISQ